MTDRVINNARSSCDDASSLPGRTSLLYWTVRTSGGW